jgi:hypothetical protein
MVSASGPCRNSIVTLEDGLKKARNTYGISKQENKFKNFRITLVIIQFQRFSSSIIIIIIIINCWFV